MSAILIKGGKRLSGEVKIQGSKNAVLPIMAASLLIKGTTVIHGCPLIEDVHCMQMLLEALGCRITFSNHTMVIEAKESCNENLHEETVGKVRASILLLGSLLGRFGEAAIEYPGGCSIGKRPVDYHLDAFRKMGVTIDEKEEMIFCHAKRLRGQKIRFEFPSVGATENVLMAAVLADGVTWIENAAREPEIVELCQFLRLAGAMIEGDGTNHIFVRGVNELNSVDYSVSCDRIVLATMGLLVAGTGGDVTLLTGTRKEPEDVSIFARVGCQCKTFEGAVSLKQVNRPKPIYYIKTRPYPGFATDVQSPLMAVLSTADGDSIIEESIFENRLQTAVELKKMGAEISVIGNRAFIHGVKKLRGFRVKARDLRGGMALVIAGMMAEGETLIHNQEVILRGYENLTGHILELGGTIQTID